MFGDWREKLRDLKSRWTGAKSAAPAPVEKPVLREVSYPPNVPTKPIPSTRPPSSVVAPVDRSAKTTATKPPVSRVKKGQKAPTSRAPSNKDQRAPVGRVAINLGIDFGTSFTKVCFRDVGTEESGVAIIGKRKADGALVPSIVSVGAKGKLYMADEVPGNAKVTAVPYLKMRLAGVPIDDVLPTVDGVDLNEPHVTRALASWFLASILVRSQAWITVSEADRLNNRTPVWSANVGVPVEHYDSDALDTFREVLGVSWSWIKNSSVPGTVNDAVEAYGRSVAKNEGETSDFHAVPEISAAVQSFVTSREATPGIYVYFDIGGGTLDGVAFNFINRDGERQLNFYSGRVAPLGISAATRRFPTLGPGLVEVAQFDKALAAHNSAADILADDLRALVGYVVVTAKNKDGRDWCKDAIQGDSQDRKFLGRRDPAKLKPLTVFVGGGGSRSKWYCETINSTYKRFQHHNIGVPPYRLVEVPKPVDFTMTGLEDSDFRRFAISYGLSIPFGEGPEVRLPSQFSEAEKPQTWRPRGVVDYADSKDVYD